MVALQLRKVLLMLVAVFDQQAGLTLRASPAFPNLPSLFLCVMARRT
jgi:hypothetical protein